MDKLQWFKFSHTDWMMGKIMRCPEVTQARFTKLICLYWNKECNLSLEDAVIEIEQKHIDILLSKKVISSNDEHIFIDFLDEQMDNILETSKKNSKAGKKSAEVRKAKREQLLNDRSTTVQRNPTDKIREEEKREEYISYIDFLKENHSTQLEQMRMKLRGINEKDFFEFFNNKCIMEDVPFNITKINARFNLLKSNWNKDTKETPKTINLSKLLNND